HRGLREGGVFAFDAHAPKQLQRYADEQPFTLDERDVAYIWTSELDARRMEIEHHLTIFAREGNEPGSRFIRFEEVHQQRAYSAAWLRGALQRAGFSRIELYADFAWEPASEEAERLFFVAVK